MSTPTSPQITLGGKTVLITGAGRGLGLGMALAAASNGARVILNDRDASTLADGLKILKKQGYDAHGAAFDVTSEEGVEAGIAELLDMYPRIDCLVNNAGNQIRKPFVDYTLKEWQSILDVHLTGSFLVTRAVGRHMIKQGSGSIIMMGSVAVQSVRGTIAPYVAAKGALTALARSLAFEFSPYNVRCNTIAPGFYETEFNRALLDNDAFYQRMAERVPLGRWGQPQDLAPLMVFLASDAAGYITGQTIAVDGGTLAAL